MAKKKGKDTGGLKSAIILRIFESRWDQGSGTLSDPVVTIQDIADTKDAMKASGADVSGIRTNSLYSFFKDFVRKSDYGNRHWPAAILLRRFTGRQRTGKGACFEFTPMLPGREMAFVPIAVPNDQTPRHQIESASMPLASRRLGRVGEAWLMQVVTRLRIVETHLSLFSKREFVQIDHLQMGLKLGSTSEIDAVYLATEILETGVRREAIVCCEAKTGDDILEDQLLAQVKAVVRIPGVDQEAVIPMAIKVVGRSLVYVVQFDDIAREQAESAQSLQQTSDAIYELKPFVPGIEGGRGTAKRKKATKRGPTSN